MKPAGKRERQATRRGYACLMADLALVQSFPSPFTGRRTTVPYHSRYGEPRGSRYAQSEQGRRRGRWANDVPAEVAGASVDSKPTAPARPSATAGTTVTAGS